MAQRVKLGKPLPPVKSISPPTDTEIDLLIANWDNYAPAKYRGLLAARPYGTVDAKARWFYDDKRGRYISRAGVVLSPKELRLAYLAFHRAMDR